MQLLAGDSASLQERFLSHNAQDFGVPAVVRAELMLAARRSQRSKDNIRLVENFLEPLTALPFDNRSAEELSQLLSEPSGVSIPQTDLMAAATALSNQLVLLTSDAYSTFAQVPNLRVDWWRPE